MKLHFELKLMLVLPVIVMMIVMIMMTMTSTDCKNDLFLFIKGDISRRPAIQEYGFVWDPRGTLYHQNDIYYH